MLPENLILGLTFACGLLLGCLIGALFSAVMRAFSEPDTTEAGLLEEMAAMREGHAVQVRELALLASGLSRAEAATAVDPTPCKNRWLSPEQEAEEHERRRKEAVEGAH